MENKIKEIKFGGTTYKVPQDLIDSMFESVSYELTNRYMDTDGLTRADMITMAELRAVDYVKYKQDELR